jgi:hypothetical protein
MFIEKHNHLTKQLHVKNVTFNYHETGTSVLEAVFARGDRRVGDVLEKAHELGCKFDGWTEHFDPEKWEKAFEETGIDKAFYNYRERSYDEIVTYIVQNLDKYRFDIETDDIDYYNNKDRMSFFNRLKLVNGGESSLLTLKEGKVVVARRCDDIALRRDILVSRFVNDADLDQKACIVYNDNDSWEADMLKDLLVKSVDQDVNIDLVESSIVSGSVIRPYSLGLAYKIKEK